MIVSRCERLRIRIETKKQVERNAREIARFKKVRDILTQQATRLSSLVASSGVLEAAGITVRPYSTGSDAAIALVRKLKQSFAESPDIVVDEQFNPVRLERALKAAAEALQEHLISCWRRYALGLIPPANTAVLDALGAAFFREVHLIRTASAKLAQAAERLPGSLEEIRTIKQEATRVHETWGQLGGGDVPQEVLTFLRSAASSSGAELDLLTEEVRSWLASHRILNSFTIRVATSPR